MQMALCDPRVALAPILLSVAQSRVQTCGSSTGWCGSKAVGRALPPHQSDNVTQADREREQSGNSCELATSRALIYKKAGLEVVDF